MNNLQVLNHPALQHKLGILRDRNTSSAEVRRIINEISTLLAYEATRHLSFQMIEVSTPFEKCLVSKIVNPPLVVSILRAGNSMLDGVLNIIDEAKVGHIGIYRDRFTHHTIEYYFRLPDIQFIKNVEVLLVDPLVATGDTVLAGIERLQQFEVGKITILCILISKSAYERISHFFPQVTIYAVGIDEQINDKGFLIPGVGDISSRLYGWSGEIHAL